MKAEWWGGKYSDLLAIKEAAKKHRKPLRPIRKGDIYPLGNDAYMKALYVYDGIHTPVGRTDLNDMSAVIMLYHGDNRFLFTGDLNSKLGGWLAEQAKNLHADIVKFPITASKASHRIVFSKRPMRKSISSPDRPIIGIATEPKEHAGRCETKLFFVNGIAGDVEAVSKR